MLVIRSYMTARNGLTSMDRVQTEFLGLTSTEISNHLVLLGENNYHGGQIYRALYGRRQFTFEVMTELSKALRRKLSQTALISLPRVHSTQLSIDGTQKYLLELKDGQKIESVFIPEDQRHTLCISTQAGCPMECQFCLTALMGFARNLTVGEIVGQVLFILKDRKEKDNEFSPHASSKSTNIVLMG